MNVYLISDTHFNHHNIKTYCQRPDNYNELLIQNWRRTVRPEDLIIHLGDVFIGKHDGWGAIWPQLPGRKILVRGNHDKHSNMWYMQNGFDFSCDSMLFRGCWLTHKPAHALPRGADVNIHGHLHNIWHGFHRNAIPGSTEEFVYSNKKLRFPWQRLFSVEYSNYMPVNMDKFLSHPDKYQSRGPSERTTV